MARGLRSDLLAFVTPPRSFGLTGLSLCWCCLRWTFRSLGARAREALLRNLEKKSGVRILRSSFASPDRSIRTKPSRSCNLLAATLNLDPTRLPLARLRDFGAASLKLRHLLLAINNSISTREKKSPPRDLFPSNNDARHDSLAATALSVWWRPVRDSPPSTLRWFLIRLLPAPRWLLCVFFCFPHPSTFFPHLVIHTVGAYHALI